MKVALKIIGTILIAMYLIFSHMISLAIKASSHNISTERRESAGKYFFVEVSVGILFLVLIWIPWKRIFNNNP